MKNFVLAAGSALLLVFSSCKKQEPEPAGHTPVTETVSGTEATIPWQDCAFFTDHKLTICFVGAQESRCPCDVYCIWEGAVSATLKITNTAGLDTTVTLMTNSNPTNLPNTATIAGKTIRFVATAGDWDFCTDYGKYEKYEVEIEVE